MSKIINVEYDFQDLNVKVGNATEATHAVNKGQVDALETSLQGYADTAEADAVATANAYADQSELDAVATAQAYTDSKIEGLGEYVGKLNPSDGLPLTGSGNGGSIDKGDWWYISEGGSILGDVVQKSCRLQASVDNPDTTNNTATNTDFFLLHSNHVSDTRHEISALAVGAGATEIVNHGLGYKYVSTSIYNDATDDQTDIKIHLIDNTSLSITNESGTAITVSGVIQI